MKKNILKKLTILICLILILVGNFIIFTETSNAQVSSTEGCYEIDAQENLINKNKTRVNCTGPGEFWSDQVVNTGSTNNTTTTPEEKNYKLLAPLPGMEENFPISSTDNTALGNYLNVMFGIFIGICAVLAVIMIVMGGIEYMTSELAHSKEHGKERITHAILGLILALGAYTLLNTINPDLLKTDLQSLETVTVVVDLQDSVPQPRPAAGQVYPGTKYKVDEPWEDNIGQIATLPSWASRGYAECTTVGQGSGCLSTRGLNLSALNVVHSLCPNAPLVITGGTEFWHHGGATGRTSHGPNSPTIDLRINSELNKCLSGGKTLVNMTRYPDSKGPYYYEGNHWHIGP